MHKKRRSFQFTEGNNKIVNLKIIYHIFFLSKNVVHNMVWLNYKKNQEKVECRHRKRFCLKHLVKMSQYFNWYLLIAFKSYNSLKPKTVLDRFNSNIELKRAHSSIQTAIYSFLSLINQRCVLHQIEPIQYGN